MGGSIKIANHERQNIFSLIGLTLFLKKRKIIKAIITIPAKVLNKEKAGSGAISEGMKNFATDSGIVRRFDKIEAKPRLALVSEILPIALERIKYQHIPEIA